MPVSMTGFGRFETTEDKWSHCWEIRSVNSRYLDLKWRLPGFLRGYESRWEKLVRKYGSRGRVDISLNLEVFSAELMGIGLNKLQAEAMINQVREMADADGVAFTPDYNKLFSLSSLWRDALSEPDPKLAASITAGLEGALANWRESREAEGADLVKDLEERFTLLKEYGETVKTKVPEILETRRAALIERVTGMMETLGAEYSEDRMIQEVAILTDKLDVSEEATRLDAHLDRIFEVLRSNKDAGKRLDFLLQETFREINTCGNKCQDSDVSRVVVEFKAELEKCREQVQNIE
ncbi:YicC/YloC family endoribonuclease [Desulfovibrio sp. UCD-KL4C]|uniref:YicC/YloC family endoribonuclease n=1 Tax=Desulfovibrio sp. UCD-KL4C TaxID=2578120 RepID=UPI0025C2AB5D|nr:YicC/YloC family endoribonuclease [Desulfovibrio sp. UCD-KL4C]